MIKAMVSRKSRYNLWFIIPVLAAVGGYGLYMFMNQTEGFVFAGRAEYVDENSIVLTGTYQLKEGQLPPRNFKSEDIFELKVDDGTKFIKEAVEFPSPEEAQKMGSFDIDDLPRKKSPGSIEDLSAVFKTGQPVYVTTEFKVPIPASSVLYRVFNGVFPISTTEDNE